MTEIEEVVDEVRRDLADGDDLAMAMSLIGDALHRRIRRVRRSLSAAQQFVPDDVEQVAVQVNRTLDRYEQALERSRAQLADVIDEFQDELSARAKDLDLTS